MIDEIRKFAKKKAKEFEIFFAEADVLNVEINMDRVNFVSEGVTKGFGIRVANKGKIGFSFTTNLDSYKECIIHAVKIAKLSKKDPDFVSFAPRKPFKRVKSVYDELLDFDAVKFNEFTKEFVAKVKDVKAHVVMSGGTYNKKVLKRHIINSEGVDAEDMIADNGFFYDLTLKKKNKLESLGISHCGKKPFSLDLAEESIHRFLATLDKRKIATSVLPVVMHPDAFGNLLDSSLMFSVNAENVQQGKSKFGELLGKKTFDEKLSINDDGTDPAMFSSQSFDDEGSPTKKTKVVDHGVLKSFLYDSYTAMKDNVESTGNASRSIASVPRIGANNLVMSPGSSKNPIKEVKKGIYVRSLLGCHTMDQATGDFSLGVMEGFYVERGEIKFPLKEVMVAGNVLEMLKKISFIGKEVIHSPSGNGGVYMPEIVFPEIKVIGKN